MVIRYCYTTLFHNNIHLIVLFPVLYDYIFSYFDIMLYSFFILLLFSFDYNIGMRRYEDGARLLTHVDREATHAASVIMNIAQNAIRTPWKVEIYDFANNLHEIEMDPGDIVYYESARCLHGRMQPLDGGYYVNLFAHYRPNGDPQWFSRSNPEGTPKQVLDIGECSSDGIKATCTKENVPYLSPKLEKLKGPDDLFRFWKETAPKTHSGSSKDEL